MFGIRVMWWSWRKVKQQGAATADTILLLNDTLKSLKDWMPQVDSTIQQLQKNIDLVGVRVGALESTPSLP